MENNKFDNRITDNALEADSGKSLISKALGYIYKKHG